MKKIFNQIKKQRIVAVLLLFAFLLFTMCITITGVTQPSTATVDEEINILVDISFAPETADTQSLIFGFLAPTSWNVEGTGVATYTSTVGNGTMSLAPLSELAPNSAGGLTWANEMEAELGIGNNSGGVKWVVYKSDATLTTDGATAVTGQIQFDVTVGSDNIITQLGYTVTNSAYGVKVSNAYHDVLFTDCMEVTGGASPTNNLCTPLNIEDEIYANVRFYPNPFKHILTLDSKEPITKIEIYSILGKKIKEIHSNFKTIPTDDISNGLYIVRAFLDKGFITKILIKE